MLKTKNMVSRKNWEEQVIDRALGDSKFKELLTSNPKEALKQIRCPYSHLNIQIIEDQGNSLTIVIPKMPIETKHLCEKELTSFRAEGPTRMVDCSYSPRCY